MTTNFTHFNNEGNAIMVDVNDKDITDRIAIAKGSIKVNEDVFYAIKNNTAKKGRCLSCRSHCWYHGGKKNKRYNSTLSSAFYN